MALNPIECLETLTLCTNHAPETVRNICQRRGLTYIDFFIIDSRTKVYVFNREGMYVIAVTNPQNDLDIELSPQSKPMLGVDNTYVKYKKERARVQTELHDKYWFVVSRVYKCVEEILNGYNFYPTTFQFIGHGIGGAIATLLCMEMSRKFTSVLPVLMTFGSPRIGDDNLKKLFNCLVKECKRFVVKRDPMPKRPSLIHNFRHVIKETCFDKSGKQCKINTGSKKIRHPLQSYLNCVTRHYDSKQYVR